MNMKENRQELQARDQPVAPDVLQERLIFPEVGEERLAFLGAHLICPESSPERLIFYFFYK